MTKQQSELPNKTSEFQNHHMDSTRWNEFKFRDDDIVIVTWAKSGTTWVQQIVGQFVFNAAENIPVMNISPWLDYRAIAKDDLFAMLEGQSHRRFIKTHLPANSLVISPSAKYIYVARDGRDALWSWYEHHCCYTDFIYAALNESPGLVGPPLIRPGPDVVEYFHQWLDGNGYPAWPFFSNVQSWWDIRDQPNVLLLHFNALKADLTGEMRKIGSFLNFDIDENLWPQMVEHCTFEYMKANADQLSPRLSEVFSGGGKSFINKGTNGRWRDILTASDSQKYEEFATKYLSPECARWLAAGSM
jgi:aryl sulfotransferase